MTSPPRSFKDLLDGAYGIALYLDATKPEMAEHIRIMAREVTALRGLVEVLQEDWLSDLGLDAALPSKQELQ